MTIPRFASHPIDLPECDAFQIFRPSLIDVIRVQLCDADETPLQISKFVRRERNLHDFRIKLSQVKRPVVINKLVTL